MEENVKLPSLENADSKTIADAIAEVLDDKKGKDIKILEIFDKSDIADYFVLCSGNSNTHLRTLADEVEYRMGLRELKLLSYEGRGNGSWILLDYGVVVLHVFSREAREFYNLDKLYRDKGKEVQTEE